MLEASRLISGRLVKIGGRRMVVRAALAASLLAADGAAL
jgi:hypothetical protein